VGEGPLGDHILRRAEEHGIGGLVELAGALPADGVAAELAGADVFLGPTRGENFFVACAEAVLAGRPVVVGSSGGHVDYLDERVSVCVPGRDPVAYADAVDEVLRRSHLLSAEQISDTLGSRFSPAVVAAGYTEAYELASATAPAAGGV
jgi:glycosyltransferase involved in cell wall biosynthesis